MASPYYLDAIARQWSDFYNVEFPPSENSTVESNMIGGEACVSGPANPVSCCPARLTRPVRCMQMWSEWVDATNSISRVWPRAAAVSENLWAPADGSNPLLSQFAARRMAQWRCRLLLRGIAAEPIEGGMASPDLDGGRDADSPYYCDGTGLSPDAVSWRRANPNTPLPWSPPSHPAENTALKTSDEVGRHALGTDDDAVAAKPRASGKRPSKPALGFNHCSVECCGPDMPSAAFMTATADAMFSRGFTEAGYEFVNMGKR